MDWQTLCKSKIVMPKKHHTLIWISESRIQKYSSKLPKFPIGRGEYIYVIYQVGGSYEEKKNCAWGLDCSQKGKGCTQDHSFFPDRPT